MKLFQQNYVKYGLLMTVVIICCLSYMEISGNNQSFEKAPLVSVLTMLAPAVVWFLGIRARKKQLKGKMTFKQGFVEGVKISLVYAIVSPFVFLLYYVLINPPIIEYARTTYGLIGASNTTVIAVDMSVQFVASILFGALYAAILSLFLKTKKNKKK